MKTVKALEGLRAGLFSAAELTVVVFTTIFLFLRIDPSKTDPPRAGTSILDVHASGLALLVGVPASLFLLGCAAGFWERKFGETKRARERERLREAIHRLPLTAGDSSADGSSPEDRPPPPSPAPPTGDP